MTTPPQEPTDEFSDMQAEKRRRMIPAAKQALVGVPTQTDTTLRQQQLEEILKMPLLGADIQDWADAIDRYSQEIAREALESLLDSELANTCVCQLADTPVCDHNWSLCNEIRERLSQQDTRSTVSGTEHSEIAPGQLTQKPPQPNQEEKHE